MRLLIVFCFLLFFSEAIAQRGKDGIMIVSSANQRVNEYTPLTVNASSGATSITVTNNTLNGNSRFLNPLQSGDLILIIQMQGATIRGTLTGTIASPLDSTWGEVLNYNNCGLYEFVQVKSVSGVSVINLDCPLKNNYTVSGKVQIVRVPRYQSLTVNNLSDISCDAWNGSMGGIIAIEVKGNVVISTGGKIDASAKGFRGGQLDNATTFGVNNVGSILDTLGAEKGEGIAGYQNDYTVYGGKYCKGAAANAGGGGDAHNAGGGGGANGGNPLLWSGHGMPDLSNASWAAAWELQFPGFSTLVSSGGGQGGYTFSGNNLNALAVGPDQASWGGDGRNDQGGYGGRPLDYSTGRIFMGGGGGAGDQNNGFGGKGGIGGGLVYLLSYGTVSGGGQILSNGAKGDDACCSSTFGVTGNDGAGGGGAGGTIIVNSVGTVSGISATANGGNGGIQDIRPAVGGTNEAEGPGGGGGGGYIAISNLGVTQTANGGNNGTTDSDALTEFPSNGATKGAAGSINQTVNNFSFSVASSDTICTGSIDSIEVTLIGTLPSGAGFVWFDSFIGGNILGTGTKLTVGPLTNSKTFYVGTCPGTYRDSIRVFVEPDVNVSGTSSICKGFSTAINATGGVSYTWYPSSGLSGTIGAMVVASPTVNSTYTVVGQALNGCTDTAVFSITVNTPPSLLASADSTICKGNSVLINVSGATSYLWSPAAGLSVTTGSSATATPTTTTNYLIIGTDANGCIDTTDVLITLNIPSIDAGINDTICVGETASLTATGNTNYTWNTGATTAGIIVSPTISTSYTVTTFDGQCSNYDTTRVVVYDYPVANAGIDVTVTQGGSTNLNASGGLSYQWQPPGGLSCTNCPNPVATPVGTTTYVVTVFSGGGCFDTDTIIITVDTPVVNIICDELYVPNFFSPNGDGSNDVFYVRGGCVKTVKFEIFDRWGKKVFETNDIGIGWDGTSKGGGDVYSNGVFVYQLEIEFDNGDKKSLSGNITLLR